MMINVHKYEIQRRRHPCRMKFSTSVMIMTESPIFGNIISVRQWDRYRVPQNALPDKVAMDAKQT